MKAHERRRARGPESREAALDVFTTAAIPGRALRAYFRRFGSRAPQPSAGSLEPSIDSRGRVFVILSNVRGELARYRFAGGRLRFVAVEA